MHAYTYVYIYMYMLTYTHDYMCVYIYIYVYKYIYMSWYKPYYKTLKKCCPYMYPNPVGCSLIKYTLMSKYTWVNTPRYQCPRTKRLPRSKTMYRDVDLYAANYRSERISLCIAIYCGGHFLADTWHGHWPPSGHLGDQLWPTVIAHIKKNPDLGEGPSLS